MAVNFHIETNVDEKQFNRLKFIIDQFHPEFKGMKATKQNHQKYHAAKEKIINDAIHSYYKEVLGNINQGNEHYGLTLVEEII